MAPGIPEVPDHRGVPGLEVSVGVEPLVVGAGRHRPQEPVPPPGGEIEDAPPPRRPAEEKAENGNDKVREKDGGLRGLWLGFLAGRLGGRLVKGVPEHPQGFLPARRPAGSRAFERSPPHELPVLAAAPPLRGRSEPRPVAGEAELLLVEVRQNGRPQEEAEVVRQEKRHEAVFVGGLSRPADVVQRGDRTGRRPAGAGKALGAGDAEQLLGDKAGVYFVAVAQALKALLELGENLLLFPAQKEAEIGDLALLDEPGAQLGKERHILLKKNKSFSIRPPSAAPAGVAMRGREKGESVSKLPASSNPEISSPVRSPPKLRASVAATLSRQGGQSRQHREIPPDREVLRNCARLLRSTGRRFVGLRVSSGRSVRCRGPAELRPQSRFRGGVNAESGFAPNFRGGQPRFGPPARASRRNVAGHSQPRPSPSTSKGSGGTQPLARPEDPGRRTPGVRRHPHRANAAVLWRRRCEKPSR